jgi:photosystem II stability/assembly factor-like uncharacterized protein
MNPLLRRLVRLSLSLTAFILLTASLQAAEPKGGPEPFKNLKFRSIGPAAGGRVTRVTGVPGDPRVYYAATAAGGVWKSTDGGYKWKPIFDDQPIASIGSVAVAPSDPNVVYVGSGEANIRGNVSTGNGIYRSRDAGQTWEHVWKVRAAQVGQIIVNPRNANDAFAAVLGSPFAPNPERGIYRTTDGGKSWKQVLKQDDDTGAIDVCFGASNPNVVFAALWQTRRRPWELTSGGPGSGLYVSRDGGDSWKKLGPYGKDDKHDDDLGKGLPEGIWGRVAIASAPSNSQRLYALIEAEKGGLYRSDDGGESWDLVSEHHALRQRAWYFSTITVDPKNADVLYCPQVRLQKSIDGGKTFSPVKGPHHGDHHDLWIDPRDSKRMIAGNDGGVDVTLNGGETWYAPPLPISQFYHINCDNSLPYRVMGNMQDLGTASGPSNSLSTEGIALSDWQNVGGGETGFSVPDPLNPDIVYAGEYAGIITKYDRKTKQSRNISAYPFNTSGHAAADLKYRFQWTAPILASVHEPGVVYHAANVLFRTDNGGKTWQRISDDLTRNDRAKQKWSGGPITGDNTGAEVYGTIFALAESPKQRGVLWAGSDDGRVHVTRDGGKTWDDVGKNIKGLPEWGTVCCIEASPFDAATACVVVDNHRQDDYKPYLFRTTDYGKSWVSLAGKMPDDVYLHVVREDPKKRGLMFAGSERGVRFSVDDGVTWQELKLNLPTVAVHDLVVKNNDLVVGTCGRSVWILDDLTPIRVFNAPIAASKAYFFGITPAIRWRYHAPAVAVGDTASSDNPLKGAVVHYYLKAKPTGEVTLEIFDTHNNSIAKLSSKVEPEDFPVGDPDGPEEANKPALTTDSGVNRAVWDLRYKGPERIKGAKSDGGDAHDGPFVKPGTYRAVFKVDDLESSVTFEVKMEPHVELSDTEQDAQLAFALELREAVTLVTRNVNRLRSVRKQLADRNELLADHPKAGEFAAASKILLEKLDKLEAKFHNPKAQVGYDILAQKGGAQLYSQLLQLGEFFNDGDGAPTQGMKEVLVEHQKTLKELEGELNVFLTKDLSKLNEQAKSLDLPTIYVPPLVPEKPVEPKKQ